MRLLTFKALLLVVLIGGCGSRPPAADWAIDAESATERATRAYLRADSRVAELEWAKALTEVSATGRPDWMARVALMRCAAELAALEVGDCPGYQPYAAAAGPEEQAYALYLRARPADGAQLPPAQQAVASKIQAGQGVGAADLQQITPPLSALVAAGVALQALQLRPDGVSAAVEIASAQGWRRALLAWLLVAQRLAQERQDQAQIQALELRIAIVQNQLAAGTVKPR